MKNIIKIVIPGIVMMCIWACDKNYNEEVSVEFYCLNNYQFYGDHLTIIDKNKQVYSINAAGIQPTTANVEDSLLIISDNFTAIESTEIMYYTKGRANGLVVFPGDSAYGDSRRWEDYPLSEGLTIVLDTDSEIGIYTTPFGYETPGEYTTHLIARNFYDPDSDAKENVYSISVNVYSREEFQNFYESIDTSGFKTTLNISDSLNYEDVFELLFE